MYIKEIDTGIKLDSNDIELVVPFEHYTHTYKLKDVCVMHNLKDKKVYMSGTYEIKCKNGKTK